MTSTVIVVGVMPTSVACNVVLQLPAAAVEVVTLFVTGAVVVGELTLLELLREHAPASMHTARMAVTNLDLFTRPPMA